MHGSKEKGARVVRAAGGNAYALLAAAMLSFNCGGKARSPDAPSGSSGGTVAQGGVAGVRPIVIDAGGGGVSSGSGGSTVNACDTEALWKAIVDGALGGLGTCEASPVPGPGDNVSRVRGAVVIDAGGRVIDNTGLNGTEKQTWLDQLADRRWVCLAGQTIGYHCRPAA
jgi:hypothetical protein